MEDILRSYTTLESRVPHSRTWALLSQPYHRTAWGILGDCSKPHEWTENRDSSWAPRSHWALSSPNQNKAKQNKENPRVSTPWSPWVRSLIEGWGGSWGPRTPSQDFLVCKLWAIPLLAPLCLHLENLIYPWVKGNLLWFIIFRLHYNQAFEIHRTRLSLSLKGFTFCETTYWYLAESQPEVPRAKKIC